MDEDKQYQNTSSMRGDKDILEEIVFKIEETPSRVVDAKTGNPVPSLYALDFVISVPYRSREEDRTISPLPGYRGDMGFLRRISWNIWSDEKILDTPSGFPGFASLLIRDYIESKLGSLVPYCIITKEIEEVNPLCVWRVEMGKIKPKVFESAQTRPGWEHARNAFEAEGRVYYVPLQTRI